MMGKKQKEILDKAQRLLSNIYTTRWFFQYILDIKLGLNVDIQIHPEQRHVKK